MSALRKCKRKIFNENCLIFENSAVVFETECEKIYVINCEILKFHVFNPRSVGSCNLVLYEKDIPEIYQNFDSIPGVADRDLARAGSSVILADYCPYVQVYILYTVHCKKD